LEVRKNGGAGCEVGKKRKKKNSAVERGGKTPIRGGA